MKLHDFLKAIGACEKARAWVRNKTFREAYLTCERGDWMLWLYGRLCPNFNTYPKQVRKRVLIAGLIASFVRDKMTDARSIDAINAAIAFGKGEIGLDELNRAAAAASLVANSHDADAATNAAAYAALSATYPICAAKAAYAADAVNDKPKSADIFRAHVSFDEIFILATTKTTTNYAIRNPKTMVKR